jgi:hypothetical protein
MGLYRIMNNLAFGSKTVSKGGIRRIVERSDARAPKADGIIALAAGVIARLEGRGAISRVNAPPLGEIPGWTERAGKLLPHGIVDIEQFVEHDDAKLAKLLDVKESVIVGLKKDLLRWLQPQAESCC